MLRFKNCDGDSVVVDLPGCLEITPENAEKLACGDIAIEADELLCLLDQNAPCPTWFDDVQEATAT